MADSNDSRFDVKRGKAEVCFVLCLCSAARTSIEQQSTKLGVPGSNRNNKRRKARGDQPNNLAPLFMTLCLTSVPTRNGRVYVAQSNQPSVARQRICEK